MVQLKAPHSSQQGRDPSVVVWSLPSWPHLVFQCLLAAGLFLHTDVHMETQCVNQMEAE